MTWPTTTKNNVLDGQAFDEVSLHDGFPGSTGANELTGYTRQAITMGVASGGIRSLVGTLEWIVPACVVRFIGFWNAGMFVGCTPNGGSEPKNFMSLRRTDIVYSEDHGWSDGQKFVFINGTPAGGLTEGTAYYVVNSTLDSFQVAATLAGAAIDLTSASSRGGWICAITEQTYLVASTHTLSSSSFVFPD